MQQQIFCVVAGQRSGTTALRSLISATGRFADLGEIFDTATIGQPESWFGYCRQRKLQFTDVLSGPDAERLCKDYVAHLRRFAGVKHLLIDVKFNSWGEIRMPWTFMHQEPFFLTQLKWMEARFLFVWRRDMVEQVLSDRISERLGKWHNLTKADAIAPFTLDAAKLARRAALLAQAERYFFHNLSNYRDVALLCYETLFDERGALSDMARARIEKLALDPLTFPLEGLYHRNEIDKRAIVANYDEVVRAVEAAIAPYREPLLANNTAL